MTNSKITYIAEICDINWEPKVEPIIGANGKKIKIKRRRLRSNDRNKLFCKCGGSIEFIHTTRKIPLTHEEYTSKRHSKHPGINVILNLEEEFVHTGIFAFEQRYDEFEPVICPDCGMVYSNNNQVEFLSTSKTYDTNLSSVRYKFFENDKTSSLCCYATRLIVNNKTKNLILQDVKNSLSLNKKWRYATKIYKNGNNSLVRRSGIRFIGQGIKEVVDTFSRIQFKRMREKTLSPDVVNQQIISGMDDFYNALLSFINPNDAKKINELLVDPNFNSNVIWDELSFEGKVSFLENKYRYLIECKLPTVMAIVLYPPLATVFFTKGIEFTVKLLESWNVPTLSSLKKKMPTAPIDIVETFVKLKLTNDSMLRRRYEKKAVKFEQENSQETTFNGKQNFDSKIPGDIKTNDKRLGFISITKKAYRDITNPESMQFFILLALQDRITIEDAAYYIEKYGIDLCHTVFSDMDFSVFDAVAKHTGNTHTRSKEIEHLIKMVSKPGVKINSGNAFYSPSTKSLYIDTLRILKLLKRNTKELLETKSPEDVKIIHDRATADYLLVKDELLEASVKESMVPYKHMSCKIDNVSINILDSVLELRNESAEMHHCVGTYANLVAEGKYVIFRITDSSDNSRATLSIRKSNAFMLGAEAKVTTDNNFVFDQLKGFGNSKAKKPIQQSVLRFLKKNNVEITDNNFKEGYDLCYAKVPEQFIYDDVLDNNFEIL